MTNIENSGLKDININLYKTSAFEAIKNLTGKKYNFQDLGSKMCVLRLLICFLGHQGS